MKLEVWRCKVGGREVEHWRSGGATERLQGSTIEVGSWNGGVSGCNVGTGELQRCSSEVEEGSQEGGLVEFPGATMRLEKATMGF